MMRIDRIPGELPVEHEDRPDGPGGGSIAATSQHPKLKVFPLRNPML
jgi:hypothetical protein